MSRKTLARRRALQALHMRSNPTGPVAEFLYTRISSDPEGRELGITTQDTDLRASISTDYPNPDDVVVFDGYSDNDRSASTNCDDFRPDYDRLLKDAREAVESGKYRTVQIRAYTSARLTRRPREYEDLVDLARYHGVRFKYLRSPSFDLNTAAGRRIGRTMAAQDAGLPEDISELVLRNREQQLLDGEFCGGPPGFGFRLQYDYKPSGLPIKPGRLVIHEEEAALIRDAVRRILAGEELGEIARRWAEKTGKKRWPGDIADILVRGRNAGLTERYGEEWGKGKWGRPADPSDPNSEWCAIITESELAGVRAIFAERDRKRAETHPGGYVRKWLGSGRYRCGRPGCTAAMKSTGAPKPGLAPRYTCEEFEHLAIAAPVVDEHVRGVVVEYLIEHGADLLAGSRADEHGHLTAQANRIRGKIAALATAFAQDDGDDVAAGAVAFATATQALEGQLAEVERKRQALIVPGATLTDIADAEDPARAFAEASLSRQRAVVDALFTVTILPGRKGGRGPVVDRVVVTPKGVDVAA